MIKKTFYSFVVLSGLILAGCSQTNSPKTPKLASNSSNSVSISSQADIYKKLEQLNLDQCISLADGYYNSGNFLNAQVAYDYTCVRFQDLPTCLKLGHMFEKGEGLSADKEKALDIYQRVCFGGYDLGCKDMKRLQ